MNRTIRKLSPRLPLFCLMTGLGACAGGSGTRLMTDTAIDTETRVYEAQQQAIKALNDTGRHPVRSYSLAKAQCWLDVSFHEYTRNDRSAFPAKAREQSGAITDYLASGGDPKASANPARETPLVNDAAVLRKDLWDRAAQLKSAAGYSCAEQQTACAEVELVHAGNEMNQQGWRHAKPYVQIAEDQLAAAEIAASRCAVAAPPAVRAPAPLVQAPAPAPVPAAPAVVTERLALNAMALFPFNRRGTGDLLPEGRAQLDELVERINRVYSSVELIELIGHTDRLGADAYNDKLSLDRAETVRAYVMGRGLTANITASGQGERNPVVQCADSLGATALKQCLQPNRRVEVVIRGTRRQ